MAPQLRPRGDRRAWRLGVRVRWLSGWFALGSALPPGSAAAQSPPPSTPGNTAPVTLSLQDALERAMAHSPLVQRVLAERGEVAARDVGAALLLPGNPLVSAGLGPRREIQRDGSLTQRGAQFMLHAEQALPVPGQRAARRAEVARAVDVFSARERLALVETRARVTLSYVSSVLGNRLVESARRREDLADQLLAAVRVRAQEGAASDIDLRLAEVERAQIEQERIEAERLAMQALDPLRFLLGLSPQGPIVLTTQVGRPPPPELPLEDYLALARARRLEFDVLERSKDELDAQLVRYAREAIPGPVLFADVQRDLPGQLYVGGGLAMALPVFRYNQGERAITRASIGRLATETRLLHAAVANEVASAFRTADYLNRRVEGMEERLLPAVEDSVNLLREGWRAGKFDFFRVIQASREASEARRVYLGALGELWQATTELNRSAGTL